MKRFLKKSSILRALKYKTRGFKIILPESLDNLINSNFKNVFGYSDNLSDLNIAYTKLYVFKKLNTNLYQLISGHKSALQMMTNFELLVTDNSQIIIFKINDLPLADDCTHTCIHKIAFKDLGLGRTNIIIRFID